VLRLLATLMIQNIYVISRDVHSEPKNEHDSTPVIVIFELWPWPSNLTQTASKQTRILNISLKGHLVHNVLSGLRHTHTHTRPTALPGPLKWSLMKLYIVATFRMHYFTQGYNDVISSYRIYASCFFGTMCRRLCKTSVMWQHFLSKTVIRTFS